MAMLEAAEQRKDAKYWQERGKDPARVYIWKLTAETNSWPLKNKGQDCPLLNHNLSGFTVFLRGCYAPRGKLEPGNSHGFGFGALRMFRFQPLQLMRLSIKSSGSSLRKQHFLVSWPSFLAHGDMDVKWLDVFLKVAPFESMIVRTSPGGMCDRSLEGRVKCWEPPEGDFTMAYHFLLNKESK